MNIGPEQTRTLYQILQAQVEFFLAMIVRPVVELQIATILIVLLVAWMLPAMLYRWQRLKGNSTGERSKMAARASSERWLVALYHLLAPILAILFLYFAIWIFSQRGIPKGLLNDLAILIWLWLGYRLLITLLYAVSGESSHQFRKWIVTPAFIALVIMQLLAILPGSVAIMLATVKIGTISVTVSNFLLALLVLYLFTLLSRLVSWFMKYWLPSRTTADAGVIASIATLARYVLLSVGIILSLSLIGLNFSSLAIVAGGLSVGIGIGLQDFVSNFVSGLVLLFEQSLRPGDVIEVDTVISQVEKVSLRATTVRTRGNEELIIPNSNFTSQQVKNLTRYDRVVSVRVPLGVSYRSDPDYVSELAVETALQHPAVLANPAPSLVFLGYGESSLDFSLIVNIDQPELSIGIRSDLYYMLWRVFAKHEIEIPFPQRDLNLGNGWEKFMVSPQSA